MARALDPTKTGMRTLAVHAGEVPDPATGASSPNLVMSSTFVTDEPLGFSARDLTPESPYIYTRWANPTVRVLEEKLAALEAAEDCVCFASGMAATAGLFFSLLKAGDHLVITDVGYAGAAELARDSLTALGIEVSPVNASRTEEVARALRPNTKLVYLETPCNPIMRLTDLEAVVEIAHRHGAKVGVDNTFATPVGTRPLSLGADYVVHSLTKYICGHGDAVGGAVLGSADAMRTLNAEQAIHHGGVLSPFNAWLIARGASTLPARMKLHQETAMVVAEFLENHSRVESVLYPGLPSHPQAALARRQMKNFSGMMSFRVKGGRPAGEALAQRMADHLRVVHYAVSLGHHRTLVTWLGTDDLMASSFRLESAAAQAYRDFAGDGIFRLSVGLEDPEDLCADLAAALDGAS